MIVENLNSDQNRRGLLIVFEGIDGTGKTTQIKLLAEKLFKKGYDVVATREPTDGQYGKKIRELYANRQACSPEEELRLFLEDRREHVRELIAPALAAGKIVLTDRYYFSTAAYQGAAGHDSAEIIRENEKFAPEPDLVLYLDVPVAVGIDRIKNGRQESLNDFEKEESLKKVAALFNELDRDYIKKVDATQRVEAVHECVMLNVKELLDRKGMGR